MNRQTTYLIILVDRKKAILFTLLEGFAVGRQEEIVLDDVPQNVRANEEKFYGRSDKIFRHIEDHLSRHLQSVADAVADFADREEIAGVFIGGHEELFKKMKQHLPRDISQNIKGTFITELNMPFNEVLGKSKRAIKDFEKDTSFIFTSR